MTFFSTADLRIARNDNSKVLSKAEMSVIDFPIIVQLLPDQILR